MSLIDTEHMRDLSGRQIFVGDTVRALRLSGKTGAVFDFVGYVCAVRATVRPGRLEALVQPHKGGGAQWLGGMLVEALPPADASLEGVLAEWHE